MWSRIRVFVALTLAFANIEIPYAFGPEVVTLLFITVIVEPTVGAELSASPAAPLPEVVTVLPVIEMVPPPLAKAPKPSTPVVVMLTLEALIMPLPFACIPGPLDVVIVTSFKSKIGGGGTLTVLVI